MVHAVYEIYGARVAGQLLTVLGRLFVKYMQLHGFSCRMDDLCLTPDGDRDRTPLRNDWNPSCAMTGKWRDLTAR